MKNKFKLLILVYFRNWYYIIFASNFLFSSNLFFTDLLFKHKFFHSNVDNNYGVTSI